MNEEEAFGEKYDYFLTRVSKARSILREIKNHTNYGPDSPIKVLAVGGEFGFIEYNLAIWTEWDIISTDVEENLIKRFPKVEDKIATKVLDVTKLKEENTYDLIIFNHVIEHILEYQNAVDNLFVALKKNGYLYLATPNKYRLLVPPKMFLAGNVSDEKRIAMHLGFSIEELMQIFAKFKLIANLNKEHLVHNLGLLGSIARVLPVPVFNRFAQTNVMIFQKT